MEEIQIYLTSLSLPATSPKAAKGTPALNKVVLSLYNHKPKSAKDKRQDSFILQISNSEFLIKYLIPFLENFTFLTKKEKDFQDWKLILELKRRGWNYDPESRKDLLALKNRMNNHRLSTNLRAYNDNIDLIPDSQLNSAVIDLLNESNIELHSNGKFWIKSKKSYIRGGTGKK